VKRIMILVLAMTMLVASQVIPAVSQEFPRHSHIMLLHVQLDAEGEPVGYRHCVDLAGGRDVPLHAHHDQLHCGDVGATLDERAGHWVIPSKGFPSPFIEWDNCAEFAVWFDNLFGGP
jgi:hypothetical protein